MRAGRLKRKEIGVDRWQKSKDGLGASLVFGLDIQMALRQVGIQEVAGHCPF